MIDNRMMTRVEGCELPHACHKEWPLKVEESCDESTHICRVLLCKQYSSILVSLLFFF